MAMYKTVEDVYKFSLDYTLYINDYEDITYNSYSYLYYRMQAVVKRAYFSFFDMEAKADEYEELIKKELKENEYTPEEIEDVFKNYDLLVKAALDMGNSKKEKYFIDSEE